MKSAEEQQTYASVLNVGTRAVFIILVVTLAIYLFGWFPAQIPVDSLPNYWSLPLRDYMQQTNSPNGWSWLGWIGKGDFVNYIGIVLLASLTLFAFVAILPGLIRKNDRVYSLFVIVEIFVLLLAASGVVGSQ